MEGSIISLTVSIIFGSNYFRTEGYRNEWEMQLGRRMAL
jgi:hypothetical protein